MFAVRNSQQYGIGKTRTHEAFACEIRMRTQCGTALTCVTKKRPRRGMILIDLLLLNTFLYMFKMG